MSMKCMGFRIWHTVTSTDNSLILFLIAKMLMSSLLAFAHRWSLISLSECFNAAWKQPSTIINVYMCCAKCKYHANLHY